MYTYDNACLVGHVCWLGEGGGGVGVSKMLIISEGKLVGVTHRQPLLHSSHHGLCVGPDEMFMVSGTKNNSYRMARQC